MREDVKTRKLSSDKTAKRGEKALNHKLSVFNCETVLITQDTITPRVQEPVLLHSEPPVAHLTIIPIQNKYNKESQTIDDDLDQLASTEDDFYTSTSRLTQELETVNKYMKSLEEHRDELKGEANPRS